MKNIKSVKDVLHQIIYILDRKQKRASIAVLFMIIIGSALETVGISSILPFIQSLTNPEDIMGKWYTVALVDIFHMQEYTQIVVALAACIIVVYFIKNLYLYISQIVQTYFRGKVQKKLSVQMFSTYLKQPYENYVEMNTAQMIRGISEDVAGVYNIMDNLFRIFGEFFTILLISIYLIYMDYIMAIGIIVIAFLCFVLIVLGLKKKMANLGISSREIRTQRNNSAYQAITGYKEIKVSKKENIFIDKYQEEYEEQRKVEMQNEMIANLPERLIETMCVAALIGSICIRIQMDMDIASFVSKLAVFAMAAFRMLPSVSRLTRCFNGVIYSRPSLYGVYNQLQNLQNEKKIDADVTSSYEKIDFHNSILVNNIVWKYKNSNQRILNHVSLKIKKGESVAIIGPSGAGKTTLADILLGLLKPIEGNIFLDEVDIYDNLKAWSKIIGFVPQSIYMLDDTIRNNVVFGEEDIDDNKVWEILDKVQLRTYVESLPEGLDTRVGERGMKISGGQRQRIAIARALYKNPEILVLDEATSALDNDTEKAVMEAIDSLQGEKTIIIIAHRISTIKNCDKIYEIRNGKIYEKKYGELE